MRLCGLSAQDLLVNGPALGFSELIDLLLDLRRRVLVVVAMEGELPPGSIDGSR